MFSQKIVINIDGIGDAFTKVLGIYLRHAFAPVIALHDRLEGEGRLSREERNQLQTAIDEDLARAQEWLVDEMDAESAELTERGSDR